MSNLPHEPSCFCAPCADLSRQGTSPTAEPGGLRYDDGKPPMALIPYKSEIAEAHVWGLGAKKYGQYNWQKGMKFSRIISCLQRHLAAIKAGEDIDKESGQPHAAHIRCNAAMLIEFMGREDLDDRK